MVELPREIVVWDVERGEVQFRHQNIGDGCIAGAISPKTAVLATGGRGTIRLFDMSTGRRGLEFSAHAHRHSGDLIFGLMYSPDEDLLVSASTIGEVKLWRTRDYTCVGRFTSEGISMYAGIAISPDGKLLAAASFVEPVVVLWDIPQRREIVRLNGHSDGVVSVDFSPDNRRLASACRDGTVRIWDLDTCKELVTFRDHTRWVWRVRFSPDGLTLASGSVTGELCLRRVWRPTRRE